MPATEPFAPAGPPLPAVPLMVPKSIGSLSRHPSIEQTANKETTTDLEAERMRTFLSLRGGARDGAHAVC
jgi:hypothetical protein